MKHTICTPTSRATPAANRANHPDLIEPVRTKLASSGKPWVIENVPGAPIRPDLKLHGAMFGLPMHRDRWFESSFFMLAPSVTRHPRDGGSRDARFLMMAGNFTGAERARAVLGMPWANRYGLDQCIPPQFSEFIGRQALGYLK